MKSFFKNSTIVLISVLFAILLLEGVLRAYFLSVRGSSFSIDDLKKETKFLGYGGMGGNPGCIWPDSHYPHPFLGFVHHDLEPCGLKTNSMSVFGKDFSRDPDDFQILFLGGSVAQQISSGFPHYPKHWIEEALNENYYPPKGKRFRVITGAMGAWKQPNQIYQMIRHLKNVDAFISLEGYNEVSMIQLQRKMEEPALPHFLTTSYPDILTNYRYFSSVRRYLESSFLKSSYLVIMVYGNLKSWSVAKTISDFHHSQVSRYFSYPVSMPAPQKIELGIRQYLSYLKSMDAVAATAKKKGIIFYQPIPNLYKPLHPKDWPPRKGIRPELYLEVENRIRLLDFKSTSFKSLTRIFRNTNDFIYVDDIHHFVDPVTRTSLGYDMMARAIAREAGIVWKLKPRK